MKPRGATAMRELGEYLAELALRIAGLQSSLEDVVSRLVDSVLCGNEQDYVARAYAGVAERAWEALVLMQAETYAVMEPGDERLLYRFPVVAAEVATLLPVLRDVLASARRRLEAGSRVIPSGVFRVLDTIRREALVATGRSLSWLRDYLGPGAIPGDALGADEVAGELARMYWREAVETGLSLAVAAESADARLLRLWDELAEGAGHATGSAGASAPGSARKRIAGFLEHLGCITEMDCFIALFSGEYVAEPMSERVKELTEALGALAEGADALAETLLALRDSYRAETSLVDSIMEVKQHSAKALYIVRAVSSASARADSLAEAEAARSYLALLRMSKTLGMSA